jgi:hypothetical protein
MSTPINNPSAFSNPIKVSTNIEDYTLSDMITILGLPNNFTENDVIESTNQYIAESKQANDDALSQFFQDAQDNLLQYLQPNPTTLDNQYSPAETQTLDWWNNEALQQSDSNQDNKITKRKQKIKLYNNDHVPMNRQHLGVNNNFQVGVAQDTLNPNLTNVTTRFINLDSQFRQATSGVESSSTDYTLTLSEPLNNVLSMWLYSIQIPHSWYTYDISYGNTCFWLIFGSDRSIYYKISIPSGNYSATEITSILNLGSSIGNLNNSFSDTCFDWGTKTPSATFPVNFNTNNGKISISLYGGIYTDIQTGIKYTINNTTEILFFDINGEFKCNSSFQCNQQNTINQTFGWYLGYRLPSIFVSESGNTAQTLVNIFGPKYLIVVIDDYNQNHINNGLVSITEDATMIKVPSYYNDSMPLNCTTNIATAQVPVTGNSLLFLEKLNMAYKKIPQVVPTAPRTLTQAQIYSINEIQKNNEANTCFRLKAPTNSNTFALVPVKLNQSEATTSGTVYVEFSGSLQVNKRIYFGPVNLERMRVKLLDDKGQLLNLNGADWTMTIVCDILYQY